MLIFLRGMVLAALAAGLLLAPPLGLSRLAPAQASSVTMGSGSGKAVPARLIAWAWALRQRGKPYVWGGTGPAGFDCSGLVYSAYRRAGVLLPRTTYEMLASWRLVRVPQRHAHRGDLAFFGTGHVELYVSPGWTFGAETTGTEIGFHRMNSFWHPTMYFRVRFGRPR